jgi:hypothetical protein
LLGIAADYDRLAEQADERAALDAKLEATSKESSPAIDKRSPSNRPKDQARERRTAFSLTGERLRARRAT